MSRNKSFMCNEQLYLAAEKCDYFVLFIFTAHARACVGGQKDELGPSNHHKKSLKKKVFINDLSCEMVFCWHFLPSLRFAKCQLMGDDSKVIEKSKKVRLSKKSQTVWLFGTQTETPILFRVELPQPNKLFWPFIHIAVKGFFLKGHERNFFCLLWVLLLSVER